MLELLSHLRSDSARFREVLAATDPDVTVPTCPGWTAGDLLWHLTEVQWFWSAIVSRRAQHPSHVEHDRPVRPESDRDLPTAFDYHSDRLITALESGPPEEVVYTWSHEQSIGWVARRQTHEALIHRVDAEMVEGEAGTVDSELAADGVDEVLRVMLPSIPEWAHFEPDGTTVRIHAEDVDRHWGVAFGVQQGTSPEGNSSEQPAISVGIDAAEPTSTVVGTAADLDLWLWGRGNFELLTTEGDAEPLERLRVQLAGETR